MGKKKDFSQITNFVFVCNGKDCKNCGSKAIQKAINQSLKDNGLSESTKIIKVDCTGRCKEAPVVIAKDKWMAKLDEKKAREQVLELIKS